MEYILSWFRRWQTKANWQPQQLIWLIAAMHIVAVVAFAHPLWRAWLLPLTPFNLLLCAIAIFYRDEHPKKLAVTLFVVLTGWLAEWVGVQTGLLFGHYDYGSVLGMKWMGVPLIIGVNWYILIMGTAYVAAQLTQRPYIRTLLVATLMTAIDVLIEPVAIALGFWQWAAGWVPLQNYWGWWITSALIYAALQVFFRYTEGTKMAAYILVIMISFFAALNILL